MNDLAATRELLSRQLAEAIAADPIAALPIIAGVQRDADAQLRVAVRQAAPTSSWKEIADALGVSKQAAHQRFKAYAKGVAEELKTEHRALQQARRHGDAAGAAEARARRDALADQLRTSARALKEQR